MSRKVILVDGPARGRIVDCDGHVFRVAKPMNLAPWSLAGPTPDLETADYNIHPLLFFGRTIFVGSTRFKPHDADLFEALASNDAKDLVRL